MTVQAPPFALHPDRLFPTDPASGLGAQLYGSVKDLPIVSPHGHTDPRWFAEDAPFPDPARLFIVRTITFTGCSTARESAPEEVGVPRIDGGPVETDPRKIWRIFAANFRLFRGTPSWLWLNHAFTEVFGVTERLTAESGDRIYDHIAQCLERPEFRPRALFDRFHIEALTTTESPLDDLRWHKAIKTSGWRGRVFTAFRPDPVVDPAFPGFRDNLDALGHVAGRDISTFAATSPRSPSGARTSKRLAAPRPTTATRPRAQPTSPPRTRPRSTTACGPALLRWRTPRPSARRC